jgi:FtsH-binding integral membrane protein
MIAILNSKKNKIVRKEFFMSNYNSAAYPVENRTANLMARVYSWMCIALAITAGVAYMMATPQIALFLKNNPALLIIIFIMQLGLVIALSAAIGKISFATAFVFFIIYAILTGVMLSSIFLAFTLTSIFATFIVTSGMFGIMALYGYVTKTDLSKLGSILLMGLIGLILSTLVNLWLKSPGFQFALSIGGVLIFTLLTAYDVQRLKRLFAQLMEDAQTMNKIALMGALTLYLDFINLFLYLLQFMGKRRQN